MRRNRESGSRRRTAGEWARIVDAWRDSGLSAREFAARRKLSPTTLTWWKWHLGSSTRPKLVPLEILPAENPASEVRAEWELSSSNGHVLRIFGAINEEDLDAILRAMSLSGGLR